jgi:cation diffusion facilitator family transporter
MNGEHRAMDVCCEGMAAEVAALQGKQRRMLMIVFSVNAIMFGVEFGSGWIAHSSALTADSLDMLGDALIYGISLYAVGRGTRWETGLAFSKGLLMLVLGLAVLGQIAAMLWLGHRPHEGWMGGVGALALAANLICLILLTRHRHDDLNLRSTWACARNDVLANAGVLVAALGVGLTGSSWPDAIAGAVIAALVLSTALRVLRDSVVQWRGGVIAGLGLDHHGHDHGHSHGSHGHDHGHVHSPEHHHTHSHEIHGTAD